MKKIIQKIKNYHPCKPLLLLYLLIPIVISFFTLRVIDNDFWFLIATGKYILNHGFPVIEPFTIHQNLSFVVQQWLTDVIFYKVYTLCSYMGIYLMLLILYIIIIYILYKICMLISEGRASLSVIVTSYISWLLLLFVRTRPQMFDFVILLLEIYILEKYVRTKNYKLLFFLPLLSLLLINLHASSWFMLFLFILPYIVESFHIRLLFINNKGFEKKYLLLILIPMFLVGFINPYGYKAITYIFTSYGNEYINKLVNEMIPLVVPRMLCGKFCYITFIIILVTNIVKRHDIKLRYLCLQLGTIILGLSSTKGFSFLLIGGVFPLAYYLRHNFQIYREIYHYDSKFKICYSLLVTIVIGVSLYLCFTTDKEKFNSLYVRKITNYLNQNEEKEKVVLYTDYDIGSYLIWNGYKVYIDPRAEVFLKSNNKKEDIMKEYYLLQINKIDKKSFLEKYDFTHLIVSKDDKLYKYLKNNKDYKELFRETTNQYHNEKIQFYLFKKVS